MDWNSIPEELLELILSNVFARERYNFSLVGRSWNAVVATSQFRISPCLMFNLKRKHNNAFFYMDFPKLENAVIRFSNHGWLLMISRDGKALFLYNPSDNHMIKLPTPTDAYTTICFFHLPTSSKCFVFGIATEMVFPFDKLRVGILKHGEGKWATSLTGNKYHAFMSSLGPPIYEYGLLFFLDVNGNVAVFNVDEFDTSKDWAVFIRCLKQRRLRRNITEHYLIKPKCEKNIFAVFAMHYDIRKVRVFRLSNDFAWELVENIRDMVFYKYHSFEGDYSSENAHGSRRLDFAAWTIPASIDPQLPKEAMTWCPQVDQTTI
ncbi:hypothetical protein MIMGU_mgv1a023107mg [Erythranthe guttata]|uniref:F-box domain-containing protein n=1 Tax=Erythranthe guttata TaxID=4155 RepID=A0A022PQ54_ERYGU|nr:hypothetical protein MIMGU_mgv1a023107mg [Erythranthe guttata]